MTPTATSPDGPARRHPVLERIDRERQQMGSRSVSSDLRVEFSDDGTCCAVVHSPVGGRDLDEAIRDEKARANAGGYAIDWKVYGHDEPSNLRQRLVDAGFRPQPREQVLAVALDDEAIARFGASSVRVERVDDAAGLAHVEAISREIGRTGCAEERAHFARLMRSRPGHMTIVVGYDGDVPAACGRLYRYDAGGFAELCGGRTMTAYRRRGLYLALVRARLVEAATFGASWVTVDALPTSEPLLRRRGFEAVTWTQPLVYEPHRGAAP